MPQAWIEPSRLSRLSLRHPFAHLRSQPQLDPTLRHFHNRPGHRWVAALVGRHTVAVAEAEHLGNAVGIDEDTSEDVASPKPSLAKR